MSRGPSSGLQQTSLQTSSVDLKYFYCDAGSCSNCQPCPNGYVGATGCTGCKNCLRVSTPYCIPICDLCKVCPEGYNGWTGCPQICQGTGSFTGTVGCTDLSNPVLKPISGNKGYLITGIVLGIVTLFLLIAAIFGFVKGSKVGGGIVLVLMLIFLAGCIVSLLKYFNILKFNL
jgi:hypothetical protein